MKSDSELGGRSNLLLMAIAASAALLLPAVFGRQELRAADGSRGASMAKGTMELGLWGGGSPGASTLIGKTRDRELLLLGLRYGWVFAATDSVAYEYTLDVIPAAALSAPARAGERKSWIYGAGLSPLGLQVHFLRGRSVQPFISAAVGFLYFEKKVPVPGASRLNVTPELGLGARFFFGSHSLTIGYKYHHLSNAYTARRNPGLDSNLIYAGFSFFFPPN
jgi:hypothetical protein